MADLHTPWTVRDDRFECNGKLVGLLWVIDARGKAIGAFRDEAVAHRVAAAPEMLEALEEMMEVDSHEAGILANESARRTLAKARGQSK